MMRQETIKAGWEDSDREVSVSETQVTGLTLRAGRSEDAETCGSICYEAFKAIADQHNFPLTSPPQRFRVD